MTFEASQTFWKKFYRLSSLQKQSVRSAWELFKKDPFDAKLGTHRINGLSAWYGKTIYSVIIEADLRIVFYMEAGTIWTVDIGTHAIYK